MLGWNDEQTSKIAVDGIDLGRTGTPTELLILDSLMHVFALKNGVAHVRVLGRFQDVPMRPLNPEHLSWTQLTTQQSDETQAVQKKIGGLAASRPPFH
jgi:hypothetical protein